MGRRIRGLRHVTGLALACLDDICALCSYRMDYMKFVEHHRATGADITIGCLPVDHERAADFGLMKIDDEGNIIVSHCWHRALPAAAAAAQDLLRGPVCRILHTAQHGLHGIPW